MTTKKIFAYVCLIIVLLIVQIVRQQMQIKELESQIADAEHRLQVRSLVNDLRVPSEAIYFDWKAMREICEIRRQVLEKIQVKEFLPYANVFGLSVAEVADPSRDVNVLGDVTSQMYGVSIYCPVPYLKEGAEPTFEKFWFDRAHRCISSLKSDLDSNLRLGKYYNEHPDEFDKVIKPWVLRMTRSTQVDTSLKACEILLKKGHRDEEIKLAIGQLLEKPPLKKHYSPGDIDRARLLNDQYKLGTDLGSVESGS